MSERRENPDTELTQVLMQTLALLASTAEPDTDYLTRVADCISNARFDILNFSPRRIVTLLILGHWLSFYLDTLLSSIAEEIPEFDAEEKRDADLALAFMMGQQAAKAGLWCWEEGNAQEKGHQTH